MSTHAASTLLAVLLDGSVKALLLCGVAWLAARLPMGRNVAVQLWIWIATAFGFLVVLALQAIAGPSAWASATVERLSEAWLLVLGHAYVLGATVAMGLVIRSAALLGLARQHAPPLEVGGAPLGTPKIHLGPASRLLQQVEIRNAPPQAMPTAFGVLHPTILVPSAVTGAVAHDLRRSLVLSRFISVLQFDALWMLCWRVTQCAYFFHPGAWWAFGQYVRAREASCDRWAARAVGDAGVYAGHVSSLHACRVRSSLMSLDAPMVDGRWRAEARARRVLESRSQQPVLMGHGRLATLTGAAMLGFAALGGVQVALPSSDQGLAVRFDLVALGVGVAWAVAAAAFLIVLGRRTRRRQVAGPAPGAYRHSVAACVRAIEHDVTLCLSAAHRAAAPLFLAAVLAFLTVGIWQTGRLVERSRAPERVEQQPTPWAVE